MARTPLRPGQRKKTIEEVVSYALSHKLRVHILIVLNEGTFTPGEIAQIIQEPLNRVANQVRELVDAGAIELAKTEQVRNASQHYYRAVKIPHYSDEEYAAMTPQERQVHIGLVVLTAIAEILTALWGRKMPFDPRLWLAWDWFNVDEQGREEIADEQEGSWDRLRDIEVVSTNRRAKTGEDALSIIVTQFGYVRARKGPTVPGRRSQDGEHP